MRWIWGAPGSALVVSFWLVTLLTACATPFLAPPDRAYSGGLAVTTALGVRRLIVSGRFLLVFRGPLVFVVVGSPLGTTVARVEIEPGGARATGAQLQEVRGADADMLTQQLLGWPLPVSGLVEWIEGRPVPTRVARVEREGGRVVLLEQDGWTIRLPEYSEATARPRRLVLERPAAANTPSVVLRLIVDEPGG